MVWSDGMTVLPPPYASCCWMPLELVTCLNLTAFVTANLADIDGR